MILNMKKSIYEINYNSPLDVYETQKAIKFVKDAFEKKLAEKLTLLRVTAPLFVSTHSGLNDGLSGIEKPIGFTVPRLNEDVEIVHSLAKWKRMALSKYDIHIYKGLYTDMNAIRKDEEPDFIHSIYVDQWDWERIIRRSDRTIETFKAVVNEVYKVLRLTEKYMAICYDYIEEILPRDIFFISSYDLEKMYPDKTPKEREYLIAKEKRAVCIMQIGDKLMNGEPHDGRAPDYDDWKLNGDIIVYYPVLDIALELSSMGIRVDADSLREQLKKAGCEERAQLPFQKSILEDRLPLTIGGGIGQSRICMFFLRKAHIGEVHSSIWPDEMIEACDKAGIILL